MNRKIDGVLFKNETYHKDGFRILKVVKIISTKADLELFPIAEVYASCIRAFPRLKNVNPHDVDSIFSVIEGHPLQFTILGRNLPIVEDKFSVSGKWSQKQGSRFKLSFEVREAHYEKPTTTEGLEAWLSRNIDGVGPVMASTLVEIYGDKVQEIFNGNYDAELLRIRGITEQNLARMKKSFEDADIGSYLSEIVLGFNGIISDAMAERIVQKFKSRAFEIIKTDPYKLTEVDGIGFVKADEIALRIDPNLRFSNRRAQAAILYTLSQSERNGHMFLEQLTLVQRTLHEMKIDSTAGAVKLISDQLKGLNDKNDISFLKTGGGVFIYSRLAFDAETGLSKKFSELVVNYDTKTAPREDILNEIQNFEHEEHIALDQEQKEAVILALTNPVSGIVGGPGTGKTTIVKALLYAGKKLNITNNVSMQAPTGRAAKRLSDASTYEATTVHKALAINPAMPQGLDNSLRGVDTVILDEASMVGGFLGDVLFSAVNEGTRLIVIGDIDQLPPVEAGAVLDGLIKSGRMPVARLKTIHRVKGDNGSVIIDNAKAINEGRGKAVEWKKDVFDMITTSDPHESASILVEEYIKSVNTYGISNVILLSPFRKEGFPAGVVELNRAVKDKINPSGRQGVADITVGYSKIFTVGDRIGTIKTVRGVPNGEVGVITAIDTNYRTITVSVDGYDEPVTFEKEDLNSLELAYATTVHKSQGSEYEHVLMSLEMSYRIMLKRKILYTGVTRAKRSVKIVGSNQAFYMALQNENDDDRNTLLPSLINLACSKSDKEEA